MTLFKDMNLSSQMQMALEENKFVEPTPIQEKTIPLAMSGVDIMGSAQTGTGKTLSFVIPMLEYLYNNKKGMGLILAPTRELAQQVDMAIRKLIQRGSGLRTALIIGGEPYPKQMSQLRANPRIIVGTPGRIIDHLERGSLTTAAVSFLVLDETDRMFDMGFGVQLEEIISTLSEKRQTLMFSATFPKKIQKLAEKYMQKPQRISVESKETLSLNLVQETRQVKESQKYEMLVNELHERKGSVIVFVKTKSSAEKIANDLCKQNFDATAIHGDLRQSKRERVMGAFRKGRYRIMVATDVAARGIDVPHIEHVINYNLPQAPEDFIHRVGRTARAGAEGSALNLISGDERRQWSVIQRMLDPTVAEEDKEFGWKSDRKPGRKGGGGRNQGANNNRFGKEIFHHQKRIFQRLPTENPRQQILPVENPMKISIPSKILSVQRKKSALQRRETLIIPSLKEKLLLQSASPWSVKTVAVRLRKNLQKGKAVFQKDAPLQRAVLRTKRQLQEEKVVFQKGVLLPRVVLWIKHQRVKNHAPGVSVNPLRQAPKGLSSSIS